MKQAILFVATLLLLVTANSNLSFSQTNPIISSFTPLSGPVGTTVTITGLNFNALPGNNIIHFGGVRGAVVSGSSTSLEVTVPAGASYERITVTDSTKGMTAYSVLPWSTTFPSSYRIDSLSFAEPVAFSLVQQPEVVCAADFDGDGKLDLVLSNGANEQILIMRNSTVGDSIHFSSPATFHVSGRPVGMITADVDGDGKIDLVVTDYDLSRVSILRNVSSEGSIGFVLAKNVPAGQYPFRLAVGDINGDGLPDFVVTNSNTSISVLKNSSHAGIISFQSSTIQITNAMPYGISIGDIDGDAKPDMVFTSPGYPGNADTLLVLLNASSTDTISFAAPRKFVTPRGPRNVELSDADGDGKLDIVISCSNAAGSVSIFHNESTLGAIVLGNRVDYPFPEGVLSMVMSDVDGDGAPDCVLGDFMVMRNISTTGTPQFGPITRVPEVGGITFHAIAEDVNNDGKPDIINLLHNNLVIVRNVEPDVLPDPIPISPVDGALHQDVPALVTWNSVPGATSYRVLVSPDSSFSTSIILNDSGVVDTFKSISGLLYDTRYYWRVNSNNRGLLSLTPTTQMFTTTVGPPENFSLLSGNHRITLSWTARFPSSAVRYRIFADTISPAEQLIDSVPSAVTSYVDSGLSNGRTRFYRIAAVDSSLVQSVFTIELSATPINARPTAAVLRDTILSHVGRLQKSTIVFSGSGSHDTDGTVDSLYWYVNDLLAGRDSTFSFEFGPGSSKISLIVADNDGSQDTSTAIVRRSAFAVRVGGPIYAGLSALGEHTLYAIASGDAVYRLDGAGEILYSLQVNGDVRATSSIAFDTTVYIASSDKNLYAFSKFGTAVWSPIPLGGDLSVTPTVDSVTGRVYLGVSNHNIVAIDRANGHVAWNYFADAPIRTSAVISADRKLIVSSDHGTLYGFDLAGGSVPTAPRWTGHLSDTISSSAAIDDSGYIYAGTTSGKVLKISIQDSSFGNIAGQLQTDSSIVASPVIDADNVLYVGSLDGRMYAMDSHTGSLRWSFVTPHAIRSTAAIGPDGTIYFGNDAGTFYALDSSGHERWRYQDSSAISGPILFQNYMAYFGTLGGRIIALFDSTTTSVTKSTGTRSAVWATFQKDNQRTGTQLRRRLDGISRNPGLIPNSYRLEQNYPNPFNPMTTVRYQIPEESRVLIRLFNAIGQEVAVLKDGVVGSGYQSIRLNAENLASGIYFYTIQATSTQNRSKTFTNAKKMVLLR